MISNSFYVLGLRGISRLLLLPCKYVVCCYSLKILCLISNIRSGIHFHADKLCFINIHYLLHFNVIKQRCQKRNKRFDSNCSNSKSSSSSSYNTRKSIPKSGSSKVNNSIRELKKNCSANLDDLRLKQ